MQLSSQLGTTCKTAWYMLKRIRSAMGQRDEKHQLRGIIEFDDACFGGPAVGKKRGRGTDKTKVSVALSLSKPGNPLVSVKSLCIKKPAARSRPGNGVKTIMVCKKRERSRAAGTAQHPVEPAPSLVQRTRAKSGSDKDLSHSQWRSG